MLAWLLLVALLCGAMAGRALAKDESVEAVLDGHVREITEAARHGDALAALMLTASRELQAGDLAAWGWWKEAAGKGRFATLSEIGNIHYRGHEYADAARWYRLALATAADDPLSDQPEGRQFVAYKLGEMILDGQAPGREQEAVEYMRCAAEGGYMLAEAWYARLLLNGHGMPQDIDGGLLWMQRAARDGHPESASVLATIYRDIDEAKAEEWQHLAEYLRANDGLPYVIKGPLPEGEPPPLPVGASAEMVDFFRRAGEGSVLSMIRLGEAYELGRGLPMDHVAAEYWFTKVAAMGSPSGHYYLGFMIIRGSRSGTPEQAASQVEIGARRHVPDAEALYGSMLMTGEGVPEDKVEGAYWLRRAVRHDSAWGEFLYGKALTRGEGVPKDEAAGRALLEQARQRGWVD